LLDRYFGAEKLAEAMVGQDGFGFHPNSEFRRDGYQTDTDEDGNDEPLYKPEVDEYIDDKFPPEDVEREKRENLAMRKGPYLELETANAVRLKDLYRPPNLFIAPIYEEFVLADVFGVVRHLRTGKKTGMPILYYRANTLNFEHNPAGPFR